MRKAMAISILTTMWLGLSAWAGLQIMENTTTIVRLEERELSNKELLKEVRDDVKTMKNFMIGKDK